MKIEEVWPEWSVEGASIGEGSYGEVYKCVCREDGDEKYSAIKVISVPKNDSDYSDLTPAELENKKAEYKDIVDNFSNEIKILETLKGNKNIVAIEDSKVVEKENGIGWQIFIRMELLTDLEKYLKEHTFEKEDILRLGIDLCQALKACSEKKIIHRDIKPSNIFVDGEGNFKLGDFGVAKQLEKTTASMSRKGTYEYMSPEVYHSQKCDSRADVYSLAIVLYRLFNNNRLPFLNTEKQMITYSEREDAFNRRIKGEKIPALNEVDENINITLLRALEYRKEDRFKNVEEFETALKRCAQGKRTKKSFKQIAKSSVIGNAVTFIVVVAIVSTVLAVFLNHRPAKKEPETIIVNESTTATTTSTTKESTTKETTTKKTTKKETKTTESNPFSNSEIKNFKMELDYILWYGYNFGSLNPEGSRIFDCKSSNASESVYNLLFMGNARPLLRIMDLYLNDDDMYVLDYDWQLDEETGEYLVPEENRDPKKLLDKHRPYYAVEADIADKYIQGTFNIKYNHDYINYSYDGSEVLSYYYNGHYYSGLYMIGNSPNREVKIKEIKLLSDEKYEIIASYYLNYKKEYDVKVIAKLKDVDDNTIWSFYKIEEI